MALSVADYVSGESWNQNLMAGEDQTGISPVDQNLKT